MSMDSHGRLIDYLRISVTDRCNERCTYCMPHGYQGWSEKKDHLNADDLIRIATAACNLGFRKFRLTGGEPLVRHDIVEIAERLWNLPGVETLGISTNGTLLRQLAHPLRQAGVRSLNISLDALDPDLYHQVTGGKIHQVLEGIDAAKAEGFECIKLNTVLMRGITESQIPALLDLAEKNKFPIRFIELMPLSDPKMLLPENFLSIAELQSLLGGIENLEPLPETGEKKIGHGPARYYRLRSNGVRIGLIGALTKIDFCGACNKLRLTSDGKLRPCLGQHGEMDLKGILKRGTDEDLVNAFAETIRQKPLDHSFLQQYQPQRPMVAIGG
ncbi:MAG: GTP 3',8-cyclase MoaA [Verrucomicrobiota bacterium]